MQQLETSKQIVEAQDKRECKGRALALTRNVYRLLNSDVFYVESESSNDIYYFVKFKPDVVEFCTCPDNSLRRGSQMKCKHLHSIEYAIRMGTLKDIDILPREAKVRKVVATVKPTKSYTEDDYSF
jgi:predicted nucleic acid-binding Zn finger protein